MPSPLPYMQFYGKDWLTSSTVNDMSLEAQGAYVRLLCYQWEDGILPLDTDKWARRCGLEPNEKRWVSIREEIMCGFVKIDIGFVNQRMQKDREKAFAHAKKQSENGLKGGRPRVKTGSKTDTKSQTKAKRKPNESGGLAKRKPNESPPTPYTDVLLEKEPKTPVVPNSHAIEVFESIWERYPHARPTPRKPSLEKYNQKLKEGASPEQIAAGVETLIEWLARHRDKAEFVPGLVVWLNQERWNQVLPEIMPTNGKHRETPQEKVARIMGDIEAKQQK